MRLIDADALIAYWEEKVTFGECAKWEAQQIIDAIEYAPPRVYVDAVSVVRCGECKWYNCGACFRDDGANNSRNADGFCSYGERKNNDR